MLSSLPPHIQQRLAVVVPLLALAISLFVVHPSWKQWRALLDDADKNLAQLETLKNTPMPLSSAIMPAAEPTPSEPPEFLAGIREIAAMSGCRVVGFDLTLPPAPPSGEKELAQGGNQEQKKPEEPQLVRPVRARIEVEADYQRIRDFVQAILRAPRLYAIASVEVTDAGHDVPDLLAARVEIERYVLTPEAATADAPDANLLPTP